jgi:curli biogenesis system outer membrane secretion channel CsgG
MKIRPIISAFCAILALQGCVMQNVSSQSHARFGQAADAPGFVSTDDLPPRKKPVLLAVYPIPDQTGANKANPDFAEISKAMPQGPEALLMEILKEVGGGTWFTLVERSNTGSLLNERQIREAQELQRRQRAHINAERGRIAQEAVQIDQEVSQLRQQVLQEYSKLDANNLPPDVPTREQTLSNLEAYAQKRRAAIKPEKPFSQFEGEKTAPDLATAEYIVLGSIVAYEADLFSSGTGLRLFNVGGLGEFRRDKVTINLRIVSASSGIVLSTKTITQDIVSKRQQGSILSYVSVNSILEFESGYAFNEPKTFALNIAFRQALSHLISDMTAEGYW